MDGKLTGVQKRFDYVTHNIDLRLFISLNFLPDNRIVKQIKPVSIELAFEFCRQSTVDEYHLTPR